MNIHHHPSTIHHPSRAKLRSLAAWRHLRRACGCSLASFQAMVASGHGTDGPRDAPLLLLGMVWGCGSLPLNQGKLWHESHLIMDRFSFWCILFDIREWQLLKELQSAGSNTLLTALDINQVQVSICRGLRSVLIPSPQLPWRFDQWFNLVAVNVDKCGS